MGASQVPFITGRGKFVRWASRQKQPAAISLTRTNRAHFLSKPNELDMK
jgi:hypothetical protein